MLRFFLAFGLFLGASPLFAQLKLENVKIRYSKLGLERPSLEVVPGDEVTFGFMVNGIKFDEAGKIDAELLQKVTDPTGKVVVDRKEILQAVLVFGGNSFPHATSLTTGIDTTPGEYTVQLTLKDNVAKNSASFEKKIMVTKPALGIVRARFSYDPEGKSDASLTNPIGQKLYYRIFAVGFEKTKKIDVQYQVQIFDSDGKETLVKPVTGDVKSEDPKEIEEQKGIPFSGYFTCNRSGEFKLVFTVKDKLEGISTKLEFPLKVTE